MGSQRKTSKAEAAEALSQAIMKDWMTVTDVFRRSPGTLPKMVFARLARAQAEYRDAMRNEDSTEID